jgi:hypothetical protein
MSAVDHPTPRPARTPTPEEVKENREWSFQADTDLKQALRRARMDLWDVAKRLHEWDLRTGWKWTGNYESLGEWLADPEVTMTRGTYYRLRDGYRMLVLDKHVDEDKVRELDTSRVAVVLKALRENTVSVEEAISDVEVLGWRDLREKYYPPSDDDSAASSAGQETPVFDETVIADHEFDSDYVDAGYINPPTDAVVLPRLMLLYEAAESRPDRSFKERWWGLEGDDLPARKVEWVLQHKIEVGDD